MSRFPTAPFSPSLRERKPSAAGEGCFYIVKPVFLFAPGAGAPSSHPWMQRWKSRLGEIGGVETFDYDYMCEGRKRPDRLPQLIAAHRIALAQVRTKTSGPIILIGKSMGGRIGCHVALEEKVK